MIPLPDYAAALETLYTKLGQPHEAAKQRELLDAIDKLGMANGEKGNRMLAVIAIAGGRAKEGEDTLRRALALNPNFAFPQAEDARRKLVAPALAGERFTHPSLEPQTRP